jgi:hypothetical protein
MTGPDANLTKKITDLAIFATIGDVENKHDIQAVSKMAPNHLRG